MSSPEPAQFLQSQLNALLPQTLDWLQRMVAVNSFTTHPEGIAHMGALTAEMFATLGFSSEARVSLTPAYGDHFFFQRGPKDQLPVLLVTHSDTVYPAEEEERNHFHWEQSPADLRIYGPGTVDNKGGTVLIWMMLRALQDFAPELFQSTNWLVAANSCEEVIGSEFARLCDEYCPKGARAVLVFEGGPRADGVYDIVTSRKGRAEYRITAEGRAAHAGSSHHKGINAVVALGNLLGPTAALTDYSKELTVNVATIHGGTVLNRVPHEAGAELEMRAYDPELLKQTGDQIRALAEDPKISGGAKIEVEQTGLSPAWPGGIDTQDLFNHWFDAAKELGITARSMPRGGLSDANYLYHLGPTLDGLGPAGANAHCSERSADGTKLPEYVEADSFVPKAALNVLALTRLLGGL